MDDTGNTGDSGEIGDIDDDTGSTGVISDTPNACTHSLCCTIQILCF